MLMIKKAYFDAIRGGAKTTTLRFWRSRRVRPGSVHRIRGLGAIRVDEIDPIEPEQLTDRDARADGFAGLADLVSALAEMYPPDQRDGRTLYRVRFTFLG